MSTHRGPHAAIADAVDGYLQGEKLGKAVLADIERGIADPKAFHFAWRAANTASSATAEGFSRALQKYVERRVAS